MTSTGFPTSHEVAGSFHVHDDMTTSFVMNRPHNPFFMRTIRSPMLRHVSSHITFLKTKWRGKEHIAAEIIMNGGLLYDSSC